MADQLPIIGGSRAINTSATASTSLIGRGLSAILNKETGLAKSDLDARYRQARDIYNRITHYGLSTHFKIELLPKQSEQLDLFEANPLQPFYDKFRQLADAYIVFQQLADKGYGKAYFPLARMHRGGQGISKNSDKADYYSQTSSDWCDSSDNIDPEIERDLGWMYEYGCGVKQDDEQAVFWYRKSAEQGHASGQNNLGLMYANGRGVKQDDEQAVFWYRKSAEQGHASGQNNLGFMYDKGRGVKQDDIQAVFWYRKSAEQGHAFGQNNLGFMYDKGRGVKQDDEQAVFWYRKVAEQGDALGQYYLGQMYAKGQGVEQDDEQAVFWYRKAAEQGNTWAQEKLTNLGINWKNK